MGKSINIENILSQIEKLDYANKLYLIERLIKQLRNSKEGTLSSHHLTELNSLGSEIWKDVDIDKYVQQERQWE
jgi:hypothetical protein